MVYIVPAGAAAGGNSEPGRCGVVACACAAGEAGRQQRGVMYLAGEPFFDAEAPGWSTSPIEPNEPAKIAVGVAVTRAARAREGPCVGGIVGEG